MTNERKSMAELHAVMERLHETWSGMSAADIVRDVQEGAEKTKIKYDVALKRQSLKRAVVSR
jgi:L-lysine 2,3-aminomutase